MEQDHRMGGNDPSWDVSEWLAVNTHRVLFAIVQTLHVTASLVLSPELRTHFRA